MNQKLKDYKLERLVGPEVGRDSKAKGMVDLPTIAGYNNAATRLQNSTNEYSLYDKLQLPPVKKMVPIKPNIKFLPRVLQIHNKNQRDTKQDKLPKPEELPQLPDPIVDKANSKHQLSSKQMVVSKSPSTSDPGALGASTPGMSEKQDVVKTELNVDNDDPRPSLPPLISPKILGSLPKPLSTRLKENEDPSCDPYGEFNDCKRHPDCVLPLEAVKRLADMVPSHMGSKLRRDYIRQVYQHGVDPLTWMWKNCSDTTPDDTLLLSQPVPITAGDTPMPHPNCKLTKARLAKMSESLPYEKSRNCFVFLCFYHGLDPEETLKKISENPLAPWVACPEPWRALESYSKPPELPTVKEGHYTSKSSSTTLITSSANTPSMSDKQDVVKTELNVGKDDPHPSLQPSICSKDLGSPTSLKPLSTRLKENEDPSCDPYEEFNDCKRHPDCKLTLEAVKSLADMLPSHMGTLRWDYIRQIYQHGMDPFTWLRKHCIDIPIPPEYTILLSESLHISADMPHPNCTLTKGRLTEKSRILPDQKSRNCFVFLCFYHGFDPEETLKKISENPLAPWVACSKRWRALESCPKPPELSTVKAGHCTPKSSSRSRTCLLKESGDSAMALRIKSEPPLKSTKKDSAVSQLLPEDNSACTRSNVAGKAKEDSILSQSKLDSNPIVDPQRNKSDDQSSKTAKASMSSQPVPDAGKSSCSQSDPSSKTSEAVDTRLEPKMDLSTTKPLYETGDAAAVDEYKTQHEMIHPDLNHDCIGSSASSSHTDHTQSIAALSTLRRTSLSQDGNPKAAKRPRPHMDYDMREEWNSAHNNHQFNGWYHQGQIDTYAPPFQSNQYPISGNNQHLMGGNEQFPMASNYQYPMASSNYSSWHMYNAVGGYSNWGSYANFGRGTYNQDGNVSNGPWDWSSGFYSGGPSYSQESVTYNHQWNSSHDLGFTVDDVVPWESSSYDSAVNAASYSSGTSAVPQKEVSAEASSGGNHFPPGGSYKKFMDGRSHEVTLSEQSHEVSESSSPRTVGPTSGSFSDCPPGFGPRPCSLADLQQPLNRPSRLLCRPPPPPSQPPPPPPPPSPPPLPPSEPEEMDWMELESTECEHPPGLETSSSPDIQQPVMSPEKAALVQPENTSSTAPDLKIPKFTIKKSTIRKLSVTKLKFSQHRHQSTSSSDVAHKDPASRSSKIPFIDPKRRNIPVFIGPADYPASRLLPDQMTLIEKSILEAILNTDKNSSKPVFNESLRRNGRYGVICCDYFSVKWLYEFLGTHEPWLNSNLRLVTKDWNEVRASAILPICIEENDEKILKFIDRQNEEMDVSKWEVIRRWEIGNFKTCMDLIIDEKSAKILEERSTIIFKMGTGKITVHSRTAPEDDIYGDFFEEKTTQESEKPTEFDSLEHDIYADFYGEKSAEMLRDDMYDPDEHDSSVGEMSARRSDVRHDWSPPREEKIRRRSWSPRPGGGLCTRDDPYVRREDIVICPSQERRRTRWDTLPLRIRKKERTSPSRTEHSEDDWSPVRHHCRPRGSPSPCRCKNVEHALEATVAQRNADSASSRLPSPRPRPYQSSPETHRSTAKSSFPPVLSFQIQGFADELCCPSTKIEEWDIIKSAPCLLEKLKVDGSDVFGCSLQGVVERSRKDFDDISDNDGYDSFDGYNQESNVSDYNQESNVYDHQESNVYDSDLESNVSSTSYQLDHSLQDDEVCIPFGKGCSDAFSESSSLPSGEHFGQLKHGGSQVQQEVRQMKQEDSQMQQEVSQLQQVVSQMKQKGSQMQQDSSHQQIERGSLDSDQDSCQPPIERGSSDSDKESANTGDLGDAINGDIEEDSIQNDTYESEQSSDLAISIECRPGQSLQDVASDQFRKLVAAGYSCQKALQITQAFVSRQLNSSTKPEPPKPQKPPPPPPERTLHKVAAEKFSQLVASGISQVKALEFTQAFIQRQMGLLPPADVKLPAWKRDTDLRTHGNLPYLLQTAAKSADPNPSMGGRDGTASSRRSAKY